MTSTPRILTIDIPCQDHGLKGNKQGYARFWDSSTQRKMLAHRKVFRDTFGYLPPVVMHSCDNPSMFEPAHLQAGDWVKNNQDRAEKGRSAKERLDLRKLTPAIADEIRARYAARNPLKGDRVNGVLALAREFGVDTNVIYQIANGRTYRHVA